MGATLLTERPRTAADRATFSGRRLATQPRREEGRETPGKRPEAVVLGAGIVGLTTALAAQEAGFKVTICSDRDLLDTTSAKAGAVFEPFKPGNMSVEQMNKWVSIGMEAYGDIIDHHSEEETGIRRHTLYSTSTGLLVAEDLPFLPAIPGAKIITGDGVPGGGHYQSAAVLPDVAMINPLDALPFLAKQFVKRGGEIRMIPTVTDFEEFMRQTPEQVVFNCTGLGSRELVNDPELVPVRGQIIVARGQLTEPALGGTNSLLGDDIFYAFPRRETTIFGGTTEHGEEAEVTTKAAIERILGRVEELIPGFDRDMILYTYAGLRPYRESGAVVAPGKYDGARWDGTPKTHVDNFGHGGSGWTFAHGAADTAVKIATGEREE